MHVHRPIKLALLAFCGVVLGGRDVTGVYLHGEIVEPAPKRSILQRTSGAFRGITKPLGRMLESIKNLLRKRSPTEAREDIQSFEQTALRYSKCFARRRQLAMADEAISLLCSTLDVEPIKRNCRSFSMYIASVLQGVYSCIDTYGDPNFIISCLKKNRLFLVHPFLHELSSDTPIGNEAAALRWYSALQVGLSQGMLLENGDALSRALAKLSQSYEGTLDNTHILSSKFLEKSTEARGWRTRVSRLISRFRGRRNTETRRVANAAELLEEGLDLLMSLPPHPDPMAVRLLVFMITKGANCNSFPEARPYEVVNIDGRPVKVKQQKLLEAAATVFVEYLFDFSYCAEGPNKQDDITCNLLDNYDAFVQGSPLPVLEGREETTSQTDLESYDKVTPESFLTEDNENPDISTDTALSVESDASIPLTEGDTQGQEENPQVTTATGEVTAVSPLEGISAKQQRILEHCKNAVANAVNLARISFLSGSQQMRVVRFILTHSYFIRYLFQILMRFMGPRIIGSSQMEMFQRLRNRLGSNCLDFYIKSLIFLSTGSLQMGIIASKVMGVVTNARAQAPARAEEPSPPGVFLETKISPTGLKRMFHAMRVRVASSTVDHLAFGTSLTTDVLLLSFLLIVGLSIPGIGPALGIILAILIFVRIVVNLFQHMIPEPIEEKAARVGSDAVNAIKNFTKKF